ncbi:MAG: hypothetical protein RR825_05570 [Ruthenibacterium sp.]
MESFVDRIIETDRKAREMIEAAQQQKALLNRQAAEDAKRALALRAAQDKLAMEKQDQALAVREAAAMEKADDAYIKAKHALDDAFDASRDAWLAEIVTACSTVK